MEIRPLREADDRTTFHSGEPDLDRFFVKYAGQNQFRHHIGTTPGSASRCWKSSRGLGASLFRLVGREQVLFGDFVRAVEFLEFFHSPVVANRFVAPSRRIRARRPISLCCQPGPSAARHMLSTISTVSEHGLCDRCPVRINNNVEGQA